MKSQPVPPASCATAKEKLQNFKKKPVTNITFYEHSTVEIMAQLMGADKTSIMEKYCDDNVTSEEMEEYFYRLASAAIMGAEALCRSLNEE